MATPILDGSRPLLERYDVVFCDIWGVLHDGQRVFAAANDALQRFRQAGGTVVLVSNAPQPGWRVAELLDEKGVTRDAWDTIVSSGDIALRHVAAQGFERVYHIGPMPRSLPLVSDLKATVDDVSAADSIVVSGLTDDLRETAESYRGLLEAARRRDTPLVCANPDLVVDVGGKLYLCAGVLGELYAGIGGTVFWAGKPHAAAYEAAFLEAARLRDADVAKSRVLAIGDAVRTDLAGAKAAGIDALFVASGIHRHETMPNGTIEPAALARLLANGAPMPIASTAALKW